MSSNKQLKLSTSIFNIDHQQLLLQSKEQQRQLQNVGNGSNKPNLLQLNNSEITTSIPHPLPQRPITNVRASAFAAAIQISSTLNSELQQDEDESYYHEEKHHHALNGGNKKKRVHTMNDTRHSSKKVSNSSSNGNILRQCKECNKNYTTREGLRLHIRNVHLDDKKHVCDICNVRFVRGGDLKLHSIRVHAPMDLRPCKCLVEGCGKSFACVSELTRHNKRHNKKKSNSKAPNTTRNSMRQQNVGGIDDDIISPLPPLLRAVEPTFIIVEDMSNNNNN
jgi:hypothetical protein